MAVEYDATGAGNRVTSTGAISWSHTRGGLGGNHWVFVSVAVSGSNTVGYNDASITKDATYGGTPMTYLGGQNIGNVTTNSGWIYIFGLQNPASGTNTVSVSITKSGYTPAQIAGSSIGYYNVASIDATLSAATASFGGLSLTGVQSPTGTRATVAISSGTSLITFTGPAGVANRYSTGASVTGTADYIQLADVPGNDAGYTLTGNNGGAWAAVFVSMNPAPPLGYPRVEPATFDVAGGYTYNIPSWCTHIDVILLGGGEAGTGIGFGNGSGGQAGNWAVATLVRGNDIPWGVTSITGTVGAGGTGNGGPGADTTATFSGGGTYTGTGGTGNMGAVNPGGEAAGSQTYNDQSYVGGGGQGSLGNAGVAPGGGGAGGGFGAGVGGVGARGQAWFYAYNTYNSLFFAMF